MRRRKSRLTVTVDGLLLEAANDAVREGRAPSVSAWVNLALERQAARERRLRALSDAVAAYEEKHGVISDEEIERQRRVDRRSATVVTAPRTKTPRKKGKTAA